MGVPILQQQGVFHAVLPAGAFTLQIEWAGAIATEPGRASAQLPQLGAGTIRATIDAPGEGSDLTIDRALVTGRARAQGRLVVDATVAPGGGSRISWSSRDAGTASPVRALRLLDDVKTLVTVGENDLRVTAIFDVTVVQGTTATLAVRLPDGFTLTSFTGAPNEGADVVDGRLVLNVPRGGPGTSSWSRSSARSRTPAAGASSRCRGSRAASARPATSPSKASARWSWRWRSSVR